MHYFLLVIAMLIWGGAWAFGKLISAKANIYLIINLRFILAALSLVPAIIFLKQSFKITKQSIIYVFITGITISFYNLGFFFGLKNGMAGKGGVLVTTLNPVFTYILVALIERKRMPFLHYTGLFMGFSGGLIILQIWDMKINSLLMTGNIYFLACAFLWSLVTIFSKKGQSQSSALVFSFYTYLWIAFLWMFFTLDLKDLQIFELKSLSFWISMIYISVFSVGFATTVYFYSAKRLGASTSSSFIFIVPVGAVATSYFLLNEIPSPSTIIGGLIAIIGVYIINLSGVNWAKKS